MADDTALRRIVENPFFVLGIPVDATRAELERQGAKLLSMLELGMATAAVYQTPLGSRARDADMIRVAMAELRDPDRRIRHELWAADFGFEESAVHQDSGSPEIGPTLEPFDALYTMGWSDP